MLSLYGALPVLCASTNNWFWQSNALKSHLGCEARRSGGLLNNLGHLDIFNARWNLDTPASLLFPSICQVHVNGLFAGRVWALHSMGRKQPPVPMQDQAPRICPPGERCTSLYIITGQTMISKCTQKTCVAPGDNLLALVKMAPFTEIFGALAFPWAPKCASKGQPTDFCGGYALSQIKGRHLNTLSRNNFTLDCLKV